MKLLTLNFLTCAIKDCKAAATATSTPISTESNTLQARQPHPKHPADDDSINPDTDGEDREDPEPAPKGPSFPLAIADATLESTELDFQPLFWRNIIPRIEWGAMREIVGSVGLKLPDVVVKVLLPETMDERAVGGGDGMEGVESSADTDTGGAKPFTATSLEAGAEEGAAAFDDETLRALHGLLLETQVVEGALVCRRCGHRYEVKEGIANFLLPPHLV